MIVDEIECLEIELSSECPALCLDCFRTDGFGKGVRSSIPQGQFLSLDRLLEFLQAPQFKSLKRIELQGFLSEPTAYPFLFDFIQEIKRIHWNIRIDIYTSGGMHNPTYYRRLARLMARLEIPGKLFFRIDGTKSSHEKFRPQVKFETVIQNLKGALESETKVVWVMHVFPWNRDDVGIAKAMAREMGCSQFLARDPNPLFCQKGFDEYKSDLEKSYQAFVNNPNKDETLLRLQAKNRANLEQEIKDRLGQITNIKCKAQEHQKIFIDCMGSVWPCRYLANQPLKIAGTEPVFRETCLRGYEEGFNNFYVKSAEEIFSHAFFNDDLVKAWTNQGDSRSWLCASKCGQR